MIFDMDSACKRIKKYKNDMQQVFQKSTIAYSYKSNNLARWCQMLSGHGMSAEISSSDELRLALKDGFRHIIFDGPLKLNHELELAVDHNVIIDIENSDELFTLKDICEKKQKIANIQVRLSHYYDDNLSRFGLSRSEFINLKASGLLDFRWFNLYGFHFHVGSNLTSSKKICDTIILYSALLKEFMPENGIMNLGSGIPADSFNADSYLKRPEPLQFFQDINNTLLDHIGTIIEKWNFIVEPGRHFVEDFGYLVGKIYSIKERDNVKVAQTNIGINWLPSVKTWHHSFQLLNENKSEKQKSRSEFIIAGFNCFERDHIFLAEILADSIKNSLFIIRGCGSYDLQTCNEWTRHLYPVYTIENGVIDIARIHRTPSDFRNYDIYQSPPALQIDEELELHYPELIHAHYLYDLIMGSKEFFKEHMSWPKYITDISDSLSFIEKSRKGNQQMTELVLFIFYKAELCGVISFNSIDWSNKTAVIGYWLGQEFQQKGIVTRAVNKLITEYSKNGSLTRFVIKCITTNKKSNNVALRCGFTLEGVQRQAEVLHGVAYDQNLYAKIV